MTFIVLIEKEVTKIGKMEKKLQKLYSTYYKLLIAQDLWPAHYQILSIISIIFLKIFVKLNVYRDTMIKNAKLMELHKEYATIFLNTKTLKMI